MVIIAAPHPVKYINLVFTMVHIVTKGRSKQKDKIKEQTS